MQYLGGKSRIARRLVAFMQPHITARGAYCEPFVGGASVISQVDCALRQGHDANAALITLWQAVTAGWVPPTHVTPAEYAALQAAKDATDPMTAFAGFWCSFAGKWFGGYVKPTAKRNYARFASNSLVRKGATLRGVLWAAGDFASLPIYEGAVIYCDPPYTATTGYNAVGAFDHTRFWAWCREAEQDGFCVLISEYAAPPDFACVLEITTKTKMHTTAAARKSRIERLFRWAGAQ